MTHAQMEAAADQLRQSASRAWNLGTSLEKDIPLDDFWAEEVLRWHRQMHDLADALDPAGTQSGRIITPD